jgi:hypothetical protein
VVYELVRAGAEYDPNIAADCLAELFEEHLLGNKCCSTKATHLALASLNALRELQVRRSAEFAPALILTRIQSSRYQLS